MIEPEQHGLSKNEPDRIPNSTQGAQGTLPDWASERHAVRHTTTRINDDKDWDYRIARSHRQAILPEKSTARTVQVQTATPRMSEIRTEDTRTVRWRQDAWGVVCIVRADSAQFIDIANKGLEREFVVSKRAYKRIARLMRYLEVREMFDRSATDWLDRYGEALLYPANRITQ